MSTKTKNLLIWCYGPFRKVSLQRSHGQLVMVSRLAWHSGDDVNLIWLIRVRASYATLEYNYVGTMPEQNHS